MKCAKLGKSGLNVSRICTDFGDSDAALREAATAANRLEGQRFLGGA